jgi:hypothetical protein
MIWNSMMLIIARKLAYWRARNAWLIALWSLVLLLSSQNAGATWFAQTIDGLSVGPNGQVHDKLVTSSSFLAGGTPFIYLTSSTNGTIYEGRQENGDWHFSVVYSDPIAKAGSASANGIGFYRVVAHADIDAKLRLSVHNPFNGLWTTYLVDDAQVGSRNNDNLVADVATVVFNNKLYIFYERLHKTNTISPYVLTCAKWQGGAFQIETIDGDGGGQKVLAEIMEPSAVVAPDGIHVYYHDYQHLTLREAHSTDGNNWSYKVLDGPGGLGGNSYAGLRPSAVVYNGEPVVFYGTSHYLYMAQFLNGQWRFRQVDSYDNNSPIASVLHGGIQVYYQNLSQIRAGYGTGYDNFAWLALDGEGPNDIAIGQTDWAANGSITALEVNQAPMVFYSMLNPANSSEVGVRICEWK